MRKIEVRFLCRESYRDVLLSNLDGGGIFIESADGFEVGEALELNLLFPEIPEGVALRGTVAWRRPPARWRSSLPAGIGVEFQRGDRLRVAFLDEFSRGELDAVRKQGRRIPVGLKVDIMSGTGLISALASDLSRGGLFVVTPLDFDLDEEILVRLFFDPDGEPEQVAGRVAWKRQGGPAAGVGIQFLFPSPRRRQHIGRVIGNIESRFLGPAISI